MAEISLRLATNEQLIAEMKARHLLPLCTCGKWQTYAGPYDNDGYTWRCHGCLKAIRRCAC